MATRLDGYVLSQLPEAIFPRKKKMMINEVFRAVHNSIRRASWIRAIGPVNPVSCSHSG